MTRFHLGRREFVLAAGLSAIARIASAQQAAPALIPRRLLFDGAARSRVTLSPDGRRIAFRAPRDGVLNVWTASLDDVVAARPLTNATDRDIGRWLIWSQDNRNIVYFREQGGDENWQAHRVDVETGEVRALTPGPGVKSYLQQVSPLFPGELLIAHNQRDKRFFDIHRVNIATGASTLLLRNDRFAYMFTDPQFRVLYGALTRDDGGIDFLQRGEGDAWLPFRSIGLEDAASTWPVERSVDGSEIYWLDSTGRNCAALVAETVATGARRVLAEDAAADVWEPLLDPATRHPIAAPIMYLKRHWQVTDPQYAGDIERLAKAAGGDLVSVGLSNDRRSWVALAEPEARPGRYLHYDRPSGAVRTLFAQRPALEEVPLVPLQPVVVGARDGMKLVCYLSRPREAMKGTPGPMVLLVHGGPWARDGADFNTTHQWLANRGYSVLSVNYRGSTGFGKAFVNAGNREWAGRMHDDLIDAVDWAIAEGVADPARVAIYGASYGGYSALVGATFTPEKFACAIDVFGISNLATFVNSIPPYWHSWRATWRMRMGDETTAEGRRLLEDRSPLNRVDSIVRPMLIAQGANDVRVVAAESEQIVAAMQRRNIPVTYLYYTDEGHGFYRPENRRSFTAVAEAFLAQHLGGRVEPVGDDFTGSSIQFKAGRELIRGLG